MNRSQELLERCTPIGALLLFACAFAPAVFAAPPPPLLSLTVDQMDQLLKQLRGQADLRAARQITGVQLTERAGAAQLARWQADLGGERSREALMAVADVSAFLRPPAAELPTLPPPDADSQKQILARCMDYIRQRVSKLPNYLALRTTNSFEFTTAPMLDSQQILGEPFHTKSGQRPKYIALGPAKAKDSTETQYFWLGSYAENAAYRGQTEVLDAAPEANGQSRASLHALTTFGEFGSVLRAILEDTSGDEMAWDHWEQGSSGPLAVFRYSVSSERSHFAVTYADEQPEYPAYHGEVAIDPASGAVWRITILATTSASDVFGESEIAVEFSSVKIGGASYICPVHSVAIGRYFNPVEYGNTAHTPVPYQISINDVTFTKYHLFRSESHILSGASGP